MLNLPSPVSYADTFFSSSWFVNFYFKALAPLAVEKDITLSRAAVVAQLAEP